MIWFMDLILICMMAALFTQIIDMIHELYHGKKLWVNSLFLIVHLALEVILGLLIFFSVILFLD